MKTSLPLRLLALIALGGLATILSAAEAATKPAWLSELSFSVKETYDSNVYGTESNTPGFDPVAYIQSWSTTFSPKATLNLLPLLGADGKGTLSVFSLGYTGEYAFYQAHDARLEDHARHFLTQALKIKSGAWSSTFDNSFLWVDGTTSTPHYRLSSPYGAAGPRERREQFQDRAKLALRYDAEAWFIRAAASLIYYDLRTELHPASGAYAGWQNFVDRYDFNGGLDGGFKVAKDWALTLGHRYGWQYQQPYPWDARTNKATYHRVLLGLEGKLTPWLKAEVVLGPDSRHYTEATRGIAGVNYTWLYTEGSLTADLSKNDSLGLTHKVWHWVSSTGITAYRDSSYLLTYRHKFDSQLSITLGARAAGSDYDAPATRRDWIFGGSAGVKYDLSKALSLTADYGYTQGHNRLDAVLYPGREFVQSLLSVGARWAF